MFVFDLPEVGEGVIEGELVKWLVSTGDNVQEDQPICELMTDKAKLHHPNQARYTNCTATLAISSRYTHHSSR